MKVFPKLLVSVINASETLSALEGQADIIDLKNPAEGPLGAASPEVARLVAQAIQGKKPFSIALGEFPRKPGAAALAALGSTLFQPDYIKVAFTPEARPEEITQTLCSIKNSLQYSPVKNSISIVAVVYGDLISQASWSLSDFIEAACQGGVEGCLIDTWKKNGKSLRCYLDEDKIGYFIKQCHKLGLFAGLAGSLKEEDIVILASLNPDIIGVRSAVCGGDRVNGEFSVQSVRKLKEICSGSD